MPPHPRLRRVCRALIDHQAVPDWWPARSAFEVMAGAVLVQNTRWVNAERAIASLRSAGRLAAASLARTPRKKIEALIRSAGCQSVKSRRLLNLASWVVSEGGVTRLRSHTTVELRGRLLAVHGIGPETADAMLCFAFRRPVFVPDQYARRVLARLGLIPGAEICRYERLRHEVEDALRWPVGRMQQLHGAIVTLCQTACRPVPVCVNCGLRRQCEYYKNNDL